MTTQTAEQMREYAIAMDTESKSMTTTQTAKQLAQLLHETFDYNATNQAAAMLRSQAAEIETLKYNVDTWYERFMESAKRCHELHALDAARAALGEA
jgi:hypothetical protein